MLTRDFGEFVAATRYEDLSPQLRDAVTDRILDTIGAALAGYHLGLHRPLADMVRSSGAATVWGSGERYAPRDAVLVNSFLSHCCYLEDGSRFTGGHPSSVVIPAAFALAETQGASGRDLITAVVVGYEVFLRLGRAIYPAVVRRGFQSTAVLGSVSSAAACASLMGLEGAGAANALAIACNLGVGLKEALKASASQPIQVARSCEAGYLSAQYAAAGAAGAETIIEKGFFPAFAGEVDDPTIVDGLGSDFRIFETYVKIHGGCRGNHAPVDAVLMIARTNAITADQVARVDVAIDSVTHAAEIHDPANGAQAQFSVAFAVAVALLKGDASVFRYTDETLAQPEVRDLMRRVHVRVDPALDEGYPERRGTRVEIRTQDGRRFAGQLDNARGETDEPLTRADIEDKFMAIAGVVLGANARPLRDRILQLHDHASLVGLAELLVRK